MSKHVKHSRSFKSYLKQLGDVLPYWLVQKMLYFEGSGHITLVYTDGECVGYEITEGAKFRQRGV